MSSRMDTPMPSRRLAWLANLTVVTVCPLLLLGAVVTTMQVGMADARALVLPHRAIEEMASEERGLGWIIEHSHRLAGWFAGLCGIALAIGFLMAERRRGFRWLGLVALALISAQGLLGIFRVSLNAWWGPGLAWIHGSFAQIVFAFLVGTALVVSSGWSSQAPLLASESRLRNGSLLCVGLVFAQLVLGGLVRHQPNLLVMRTHMVVAFIVLAALLWLCITSRAHEGFRWPTRILMVLLGLQVMLGVEVAMNWMVRFIQPELAIHASPGMLLLRTLHYFVGSLLFATTAVIALKAHRDWLVETVAAPVHPPYSAAQWEGAL